MNLGATRLPRRNVLIVRSMTAIEPAGCPCG